LRNNIKTPVPIFGAGVLECKEYYFLRGGYNYFFVEVFTSCAVGITFWGNWMIIF
jgi:hypothetical protein